MRTMVSKWSARAWTLSLVACAIAISACTSDSTASIQRETHFDPPYYDSLEQLAAASTVIVEATIGELQGFYSFPGDPESPDPKQDAGFGYRVWHLNDLKVIAGQEEALNQPLVGTFAPSATASEESAREIAGWASDLTPKSRVMLFLAPFTFPGGPPGYAVVGADYGVFRISQSESASAAPTGGLFGLVLSQDELTALVAKLPLNTIEPEEPGTYKPPEGTAVPTTRAGP